MCNQAAIDYIVNVAEIACDADYEYFVANGSSVANVEAEILPRLQSEGPSFIFEDADCHPFTNQYEILPAIAVVIDPGGGEARPPEIETGVPRHVFETTVADVFEQQTLAVEEAEAGGEEVDATVVVVVRGGEGESVEALVEA